jgi:hypothetical protein
MSLQGSVMLLLLLYPLMNKYVMIHSIENLRKLNPLDNRSEKLQLCNSGR